MIIQLLSFVLMTALLVSCGGQQTSSRKIPSDIENHPALMVNISVDRWGQQKLSGLLAIREKDGKVFFALLDVTGVTLLEGELSIALKMVGYGLKGPMSKSDAGDYLATAFTRIFLLEPAEVPCSRGFLSTFCFDVDNAVEGGRGKYEKIGPFTRWSVVRRQGSVLEYNQPWLGVHITLQEIKNKERK